MKQINKIKSVLFGDTPIYEANDGKPIEQITIKYKQYYFFIDLDGETGEPTGGFGWSNDPSMNPTVEVRDILIAEKKDYEVNDATT